MFQEFLLQCLYKRRLTKPAKFLPVSDNPQLTFPSGCDRVCTVGRSVGRCKAACECRSTPFRRSACYVVMSVCHEGTQLFCRKAVCPFFCKMSFLTASGAGVILCIKISEVASACFLASGVLSCSGCWGGCYHHRCTGVRAQRKGRNRPDSLC